ncbi:hypothetical protein [Metabacillus fastidiosus]|uniref:hypothetical protein n=1 Tax=Metabacillus fastidiosus TaxID=1458 RepID=UPI003D2E1B7F
MIERKVVLLYGDILSPFKHIEKITIKYHQYYLRDKDKEDFSIDNYYEIWIDERYTGINAREPRDYTPVILVKKEFLSKFLNIFRVLKGNMCLCKLNHEHLISYIDGFEYEGYCFYMKNEEKKILFLEEYGPEDNGMSVGFIPKKERYSIKTLEWYKSLSEEKKFKILDVNIDTELAFDQWVKEIVK